MGNKNREIPVPGSFISLLQILTGGRGSFFQETEKDGMLIVCPKEWFNEVSELIMLRNRINDFGDIIPLKEMLYGKQINPRFKGLTGRNKDWIKNGRNVILNYVKNLENKCSYIQEFETLLKKDEEGKVLIKYLAIPYKERKIKDESILTFFDGMRKIIIDPRFKLMEIKEFQDRIEDLLEILPEELREVTKPPAWRILEKDLPAAVEKFNASKTV